MSGLRRRKRGKKKKKPPLPLPREDAVGQGQDGAERVRREGASSPPSPPPPSSSSPPPTTDPSQIRGDEDDAKNETLADEGVHAEEAGEDVYRGDEVFVAEAVADAFNKPPSHVWNIFLCGMMAILVYSNSLPGAFTFDDHLALVNNLDTHPARPFGDILKHDFWGQDLQSNSSHKSYRPLTVLLFRLTRVVSASHFEGDSEPVPLYFHVQVIVMHAMNSMLVYRLALSLLEARYCLTHGGCGCRPDEFWCATAARYAGLLFAVHPVHTESVDSAVGYADVLSCMLGLQAVLVWNGTWEPMLFVRALSSVLTVILFVAGLLAKEVTATMPAMILAMDFFHARGYLSHYRDYLFLQKGLFTQLRFLSRRILFFVALTLGYVLFRSAIMNSAMAVGHEVLREVENPIRLAPTMAMRALTTMYINSRYLWLLVFPRTLSVDYSFDCIPVIEEWSDPRVAPAVVGCVVFLLLGAVAIIYTFTHRPGPPRDAGPLPSTHPDWSPPWCYACDAGIATMCWLWMFMPFLPASNIFFYVGTTIAERLLYIPSIGFCILVGYALQRLLYQRPNLRSAIFCVIFALCIARTIDRNKDWASEERLFSSAMDVCPNSVKVLQNMGIIYRRTHEWDRSLAMLDRAQEILPSFCDVNYWRGLAYLSMAQLEEATHWLKTASKCVFNGPLAAQALVAVHQYRSAIPGSEPHDGDWADIVDDVLQQPDLAMIERVRVGLMHAKAEEYGQAYAELAVANKKYGKRLRESEHKCTLLYWFGYTCINLDKIKQGAKLLKEVIADPDCHDFREHALHSLLAAVEPHLLDASGRGLSATATGDMFELSGFVLERLDSPEKAADYYREAGVRFLGKQDVSHALRVLKKARRLLFKSKKPGARKDDRLTYTLGFALLQDNQVDKGLALIRRVIGSDDDDVREAARNVLSQVLGKGAQ